MTGSLPHVPPIVMMGVSASGKSVVGKALAARLGCPFIDGDALHPQANVEKMAAGHPLDDADRAPWLDRVAAWLSSHEAGGVVACSALKRRYRDRLRRGAPDAVFVLLDPPGELLRDRDVHRQGHFMPASLLDSQLATLERPDADEHAIVVSNDGSVTDTVEKIVAALAERLATGTDRPS
ncbi:MAG: gluconokinase [Sphingomonas sp.]